MVIAATTSKLHWNYFLALEHDLELVARYVEFSAPNFSVYSIELAHLLFAAASEVDVVAKLLCENVNPTAPRENIHQYREVLLSDLPDLPTATVFVPRYGLSFQPWSNWGGPNSPDWWRSYNRVKHERDSYFQEATLQNALNSLGALLLLTFHLYARLLAKPPDTKLRPKDTMASLDPNSSLLRLDESFYYAVRVVA